MTSVLAEKTCTPCRGSVPPLTVEEAEAYHLQAPEWALRDETTRIERTYRFRSFGDAFAFVRGAGELAEAEFHHPDISFGWGYATVSLRTKKIKGLHENDFIMAVKLDRLARSTRDLLNTLAAITDRKAGFRSLSDAWADTMTPRGRLMLTVLGGLAEFERDLIRARTSEAASAPRHGREDGPPPEAHPAPAARGAQASRP